MTEASNVSLSGETAKGTLAKLLMAASGFIGTIIFARVLGPTAFGGFYLLFSLVKLIDRPVGGFGSAAKKRYSEHGMPKREIIGAQLIFSGIWLATAFAGAIVFANWIRSYTSLESAAVLFVLLVLSTTLFEPFNKLIEAQGLIGIASWIDTIRSYLTLPLQLGFVFLGFGAAGMAYGLVGATLLVIPAIWYYIHRLPAVPSRGVIFSMWEYARYSIPNTILGRAYDKFDILLLGILLSPSAAGQYQVAIMLTLPGAFVTASAGSGLMAKVSNLRSKGRSVSEDVSNTLSFTSILSIPIFFGVLALSQPIVVTFYGGEYSNAASLLMGLALYQVIRTQTGPLGQTINGLNAPRINTYVATLALAVNILLGVALTLEFGAIGVVIATIVAQSMKYVILGYTLKKMLPSISLWSRAFLDQLLASFVMFVVVYGLHKMMPVRYWGDLIVLVGVGAIVYGALLFTVSHHFRITLREMVQDMKLNSFLQQ